jgi:hypothetical protein
VPSVVPWNWVAVALVDDLVITSAVSIDLALITVPE